MEKAQKRYQETRQSDKYERKTLKNMKITLPWDEERKESNKTIKMNAFKKISHQLDNATRLSFIQIIIYFQFAINLNLFLSLKIL